MTKAAPNYDDFFTQLHVDKTLVGDFFIIFARFEYALKRAGFTNGSADGVSPDWMKFASSLKEDFNPNKSNDLQDAVAYLDTYPPKKQVLAGKVLSWQDNVKQDNEPTLIWMIRLIKTVRNNLFHGGKFSYGEIRDPSRNALLLESALTILYECLDLSEKKHLDVKSYFSDYMA